MFLKYVLFLLIIAPVFAQNTASITIITNIGIEARLDSYTGFNKNTIAKIQSDAAKEFKIQTDYKGLAFLNFSTGQNYPVYLTGKDFLIRIIDPLKRPMFSQNTDSEYLYQWLSSYKQLQKDDRLLQSSLSNINTNDPFYSEIINEQKRIEQKRLAIISNLNKEPSHGVNLLIQARILNESTYSLKTKEALELKKKEYQQFVQNNLIELYYSDMLLQLCHQDLMMNEYVLVTNTEMYSQINKDVQRWVSMLSPRIEAKETIAFIMKIFYNRGMVSIAAHILQNNRNILDKKVYRNSPNLQSLYNIGETVLDLNIEEAIHSKGRDLTKNKNYKIVSLVDVDDVVSQVSTITLARQLDKTQSKIPIIIIPKEKLTQSHFDMDNLFSGTLYYSKEKNVSIIKEIDFFQFYFLDENNRVERISNNLNEIVLGIQNEN